MRNTNIQENTIEKALIAKRKNSLSLKNNHRSIVPILKTATGIIFYTATFIVSVAVGYIFIFSVFN